MEAFLERFSTADGGADFGAVLGLNDMTVYSSERSTGAVKIAKTEDEGAAFEGVFVD